jgi:cytochrome P450
MKPTRESVDLNPFDPSFWADPYSFYPALLAGLPRRLSLFFPTVLVTRYCDVVSVLGDPARFSSCVPQLPFISKLDPFGGAPTMLLSDPPVHTRLRKLVTGYFRASTIDTLGARIRALTRTLLDRIAAKGEFDGVLDLAVPLPVAINAEVLGVPIEDQPMLKAWSDEIFAAVRRSLAIVGAFASGGASTPTSADVGAQPVASPLGAIDGSIPATNADAMAALRDYFLREIERRKARPGDDLVSAMVSAQDRGAISRDELIALVMLLLFAGNETTTNLIANGLLALCRHRNQVEHLTSAPELIPRAIEEILRYDSPTQMVMRYATDETHLGGTPIPSGAALLVMLGAANRDPAQFPEPERFDVGRHPNQHVAFGSGIHSCVGSHLARLQGQVAIGAMLERFPAFRLREPDAPLQYSGSLLSRGLSTLLLVTG